MNTEWKTFLESRSATIGEDGLIHISGNVSDPDNALCDLSHLGLIRVAGEDAVEFLQGQLTNDIRELTDSNLLLSAYCNPKGRIFSNFWIFRRGDEIFLQLPGDRLEAIQKRLSMFLLRSKANLTDAGDELIRIGTIGPKAECRLKELIPALPEGERQAVQHEGLTILRLPSITPRFEIIGEPTQIKDLWQELAEQINPSNSSRWQLEDIRSGIPNVYSATAEAFIPHMLNMQLLDGISFTKGCYCGQEVVARTQYRGTLKRRMYLSHIDSEQQPKPGDELFSPSAESDQGAGMVVDAQPAPNGGYDALVMLQIAGFEADDVHLGDSNGAKLSFGDLPYSD